GASGPVVGAASPDPRLRGRRAISILDRDAGRTSHPAQRAATGTPLRGAGPRAARRRRRVVAASGGRPRAARPLGRGPGGGRRAGRYGLARYRGLGERGAQETLAPVRPSGDAVISREDVEHVARLARLHLSDDELTRIQAQLSGILGYIDKLR